MNSLNRDREEKETRIELLKKDFVAWRKKWLEEWSINGCPGGENKPDNHYLLFYWFEEKLQEAKAEEEARWLNQSANEHDKRIREDERKRCLGCLPKPMEYVEIVADHRWTNKRKELYNQRKDAWNECLDQAISAITKNK